jgi:hypothetical protein
MRILLATRRVKVFVLRQKSRNGLKWEILSSAGP